MSTYCGPAACVLPGGISMPASVSLTSEPGLLNGLVGTATSPDFPLSYLNATEVTVRLPDELPDHEHGRGDGAGAGVHLMMRLPIVAGRPGGRRRGSSRHLPEA